MSQQVKKEPVFRKLHNEYRIDYFHNHAIENAGAHQHDFYEIIFIINDNVSYIAKNAEYRMLPMDILLISPGTQHSPAISNNHLPAMRYVLWLRTDFLDSLCTEDTDLGMCFGARETLRILSPKEEEYPILLTLFQDLYQGEGAECFARDVAARVGIEKILILLNRIALAALPHAAKKPGQENQLIQSVIQYILRNYQSSISLEGISTHFFVNKFYLSRTFKEMTGKSMYQYITEQRMRYAQVLISRGVSLAEVSRLCGFASYSSFYRQFGKHYQITPSQAREG